MNILSHLTDPVFLYRPAQIVRRLVWELRQAQETEVAKLAWNGHLKVWPSESVGRNILHRGVHDLAVVEACFRLANPGSMALDIGAHVGQMTSALAHAVGAEGTVIAAEPHPLIRKRLRENIERIQRETDASIEFLTQAVCNTDTTLSLHIPRGWNSNRGTATLEKNRRLADMVEVEGIRLDTVLGRQEAELMKVDVEGAEAEAFEGAEQALSRHQITHILFEDHTPEESAAVELLQAKGYAVYTTECQLTGPVLRGPFQAGGWPEGAYNFIATSSPEGLHNAYKENGWRCLQ